MPFPYTPNLLDAYMTAQLFVGLLLTAIVWFRPLRPWPSSVLFVAAVWMTVLAPLEPNFLGNLGAMLAVDHYVWFLRVCAAVATAAMVSARPRWIIALALAGELALWRACGWVKDASFELAALHLVWLGVLLALHLRFADRSPFATARPLPLPTTARKWDDVAIFVGASALAMAVCAFVLAKQSGSGDEWANTYQADLFAHLRAYGTPPPCPRLQQNFWIFFYMGRSFSQYTPGWPLVMAPFQRFHAVWMANPLVLGVMAIGVARLARRAAAAGIAGVGEVTASNVRAAGIIAAIMATTGASMLLNGASRYPHPMVCACFAWSIESLCAMSSPDTPARAKWRAGLVFGTATSLLLATRPVDGALLGVGIFAYFAWALVRRRLGRTPVATAAVAFAAWAALTLVILRLQLGAWFQTGYQITSLFHPWATPTFHAAQPDELRHIVPLATGAFMWWPASPAVGVAGILCMRGRARPIAFMFGVATCLLLALYFFASFGHAPATGYGPRLHLALVVPMAVGGAVIVAPLWAAAMRRSGARTALARGGPATLALFAIVAGVLRIAPVVYPPAQDEMHKKLAPFRAIARKKLHHAVVTVTRGEVYFDPMDLVQNLPTEAEPDVLLLHQFEGPELECGRRRYDDRAWYHAEGLDEVLLTPQ